MPHLRMASAGPIAESADGLGSPLTHTVPTARLMTADARTGGRERVTNLL